MGGSHWISPSASDCFQPRHHCPNLGSFSLLVLVLGEEKCNPNLIINSGPSLIPLRPRRPNFPIKMFNLMTESFERVRGRYPGESDGDSVSGSTHGMDGFFKQVAEVERLIEKINTQLGKLQAAKVEGQQATKASAMTAIKERMQKDIEEVSKIALKVKASLEALDRDNVVNRKKPGCQMGSGVDRSRTSMTTALKKKLKERMSQFQNLKESIQAEYREGVERRVFTVTGTHPDEETINQLIETGNSDQIFQNAIQGHGRGQVMDTLAEIQERRDNFIELEKNLLDLQQVFMDMSVLVNSQGELLDDIETQVSSSVDHVQSATGKLQEARKYQKNTRKWKFIAILLLLVMIAIAIYPMLKYLKKDEPAETPKTN